MSSAGLSDSTFSDLGGAVSSLFGALGAESSASAYGKAAQIAETNAAVSANSGLITAAQTARQSYQTISTEQATTAGAGFNTSSGSAGDLMRSSASQAALSKQLVLNQSELTTQGYEQQATAYQGQEAAAKTQGAGGFLGSLLKVGAAVAPFL